MKCFSLPRAMQKEGATAESFAAEDLDDPDGLFDEHKDEIIAAIESKGDAKTPKKKKDDSAIDMATTMIGAIKRNYEAVQNAAAAADDDRPAKKVKLSSEQQKEVELYEAFTKMTSDEIKDFLRYVY